MKAEPLADRNKPHVLVDALDATCCATLIFYPDFVIRASEDRGVLFRFAKIIITQKGREEQLIQHSHRLTPIEGWFYFRHSHGASLALPL